MPCDSDVARKRTTSKFTSDTSPRSRTTVRPAASSCELNSARCSERMRPISLIVVHRWPGVVSILNVTRFCSARRGPLQKRQNNWNRIEKFALAWEIAQIRARTWWSPQRRWPATAPQTVCSRLGLIRTKRARPSLMMLPTEWTKVEWIHPTGEAKT
jgi:hypothetical protein